MMEIAQLKEDTKRLTEMLRQTKEYKDFGLLVDDSGGEVRYLESLQQPSNN